MFCWFFVGSVFSRIAPSIDNLAIGFALGACNVNPAAAAVIIGAVSVTLSLGGLELGDRLGAKTGERGEQPVADCTALKATSRVPASTRSLTSSGSSPPLRKASCRTPYPWRLADRIALASDDPGAVAKARAELGYVDFLRARYDRAEFWLTDALELAHGSPSIMAKATTYLGAVESDRADYARAVVLLQEAAGLSRAAGDPRREAFGLSMLGRIDLLRGDLDSAIEQFDASISLAERDHWLSFLPWPQALQGEAHLARADPARASEILRQAFARACQLGDPCWEGMSARGLALVTDAIGETNRAFEVLADARVRANRLADPYVWLDVYILDAQCNLGRRHGHPGIELWADTMRQLASRSGMRELIVRSMIHGAALGNEGDAAAAALLAADIENPVLDLMLSEHCAR